MEHTQVDNEEVQVYKDFKISLDKYVFHFAFYALDMDAVDIIFGYPWMVSIGTININVEEIFLKLLYKNKKIKLQHIFTNKQVESKEAWVENFVGNNTSGEESMVKVTLEDKKQL